jgi:hypothetical protein
MLAEVAVAVAICYFLLGGREWSAGTWAAFAVLAGWIIIMNVGYEDGMESKKSYLKWKQTCGLLLVLGLLGAGVWRGSLGVFIVGVIVGAIWLDDYRHMKEIFQKEQERPSEKEGG